MHGFLPPFSQWQLGQCFLLLLVLRFQSVIPFRTHLFQPVWKRFAPSLFVLRSSFPRPIHSFLLWWCSSSDTVDGSRSLAITPFLSSRKGLGFPPPIFLDRLLVEWLLCGFTFFRHSFVSFSLLRGVLAISATKRSSLLGRSSCGHYTRSPTNAVFFFAVASFPIRHSSSSLVEAVLGMRPIFVDGFSWQEFSLHQQKFLTPCGN